MKRFGKRYIVLIAIPLLLTILFLIIYVQDKTEIDTFSFIREQSTFHTAYYDDTYFYYDKDKDGICTRREEQENFIFKTEEPQGISVNEQYIYTMCDNKIRQYKKNGNLVAQYEGEFDDIYASEKYVYCIREGGVLLLSSGNISEPVKPKTEVENIEKNMKHVCQCSLGQDTINYETLDMGSELIVWSWFLQEGFRPEIQYLDTGIWFGGKCTVISKQTGNPLVRSRFSPLNLKNGSVIVGDVVWETTERIFEANEYKTEELIDLQEDVVVLPEGGGTAFVDESILCVAGSLFDIAPLPFSSHSSYGNGSMNHQTREVLRYFDLRQKKEIRNYHFTKGNKVIYADKDGFILYHKGGLEFYNAEDGSLKKRVKVNAIKRNTKYMAELCYDKLFIYHGGAAAEIINVK